MVERPQPSGGPASERRSLTDVEALGKHVRNWRAMLRYDAEFGDADAQAEAAANAIEARLRTGRPLGPEEWILRQEEILDRTLAPQKRGPKPKTAI